MSFPHLGKNNFEKLKIYSFLVEIQGEKKMLLLGKSASSAT
jgi:hypothetical protein